MFEPVLIENGDYICINVVTGTVWLEKRQAIPTNQPWRVSVPPPGTEDGMRKRHFPADKLFARVKNPDAWNTAYTLAYALTWVVGLHVGDDTGNCLNAKDTYVFIVT